MSALAISTYGDLITLALKNAGVLGVGQTPLAEDTNDVARMLNAMIAQWQRRRYLVYHLIDVVKQSTGAQSYTVGPSGDFAVANRPAEIKSMFARQTVQSVPNQIDYPIIMLPSREDYNQIALKSLQSFPTWAWYDAAMPLGKLYVYPIIQSTFELHIAVEEVLQTVDSLTTAITVPPEYIEAMVYNLAVRICANYGLDVPPAVASLAQAALETLRSVNAQVPRMNMPVPIYRPWLYNIFSDTSY
jgi:hypothetical protein